MLNISWKAGPALGLGQLGHCLGPPPIEKGPKFGGQKLFLFFILFYFIYIYIYINWEIEIRQNLRRPKELSNARDRDKLNLNK